MPSSPPPRMADLGRDTSWDLNLHESFRPPSPLSSPLTRRRRPRLVFQDEEEEESDSESDNHIPDEHPTNKHRRYESLPAPTDEREMRRLLGGMFRDEDGSWVRKSSRRPPQSLGIETEESPLVVRWDHSVITEDQQEENSIHEIKEEDSTTHSEGQTLYGTVIETVGDAVTEAWNYLEETKEEVWEELQEKSHYDWRQFWKGGGPIMFIRWLLTGFAANAKLNDEEIQENLNCLARLLTLLREYHDTYGMPSKGGPKDREYVLREIIKDLYAGGAPVWTLQPVMTKVAEGLTGKRGVDFFLLPRRAFIFAPSSGATIMFPISRGYDMHKLDEMEKVAVRLASFASNSSSVSNIPARFPNPREMRRALYSESFYGVAPRTQEELAEEILSLASEAEGLFFFINSSKYKQSVIANQHLMSNAQNHTNNHTNGNKYLNSNANLNFSHEYMPNLRDLSPTELEKTELQARNLEMYEFWNVEDHIQELFCRLATVEAIGSIDKMDAERTVLYNRATIMMFRFGAAAGACAFWFQGSWFDMIVAGTLAAMVAYIDASPLLTKQERIIFEAVSSFAVGFVSTAIAVTWPKQMCFSAIAIAALLDVLDGYRVVYAIMEIMSRHTETGGADLMEGVLFTALMAYFLKFGQYFALNVMGIDHGSVDDPDGQEEQLQKEYMICDNGISPMWFPLFVPLSAICWSGLFNPAYYDIPAMAFHGVIGYVVSQQFNSDDFNSLNNFLAAMAITFCAGLVSRFTGRQALGNTVAGLYFLVPDVYMFTTVYSDEINGFLMGLTLQAIIIGIGAWTGTILCSPTVLGTNRGLMNHGSGVGLSSDFSVASPSHDHHHHHQHHWKRRDKAVRKKGTGALLFF